MLAGTSACLGINHAWLCRAILAFCWLSYDRGLDLSLSILIDSQLAAEPSWLLFMGRGTSSSKMASASDISDTITFLVGGLATTGADVGCRAGRQGREH